MEAKNTIVKKSGNNNSLSAYLATPAVRQRISDVVGGSKAESFITSIVSAVSLNPSLAQCDKSSIFNAALLGQALNLSPSPQLGQFYMVPYKDSKRGQIAQFQMGYKGYIQLAMRSGQFKKINVLDIKEGELKTLDLLNETIEAVLITDPEKREQAKTIGYYAMFELINGFQKVIYWSKEKMLAHAKRYSSSFAADLRKGTKYTFWSKDFDGMAFKTLLRQLLSKWAPLSSEMENAYQKDMGAIADNGDVDYIDNKGIYPAEEVKEVKEDSGKQEDLTDDELADMLFARQQEDA